MKALAYAGMPTHNTVALPVPARVHYPEDLLALALGGVRGRVHRRIDARGTALLIQSDDAWTEQLLDAVRAVLAQDEPAPTRDALIDLGALVAEWVLALDSTPKGQA